MKSTMSVSVALVFLELFAISSFCSGNSYVGCTDSEREALLKLKQDLKDPSNRLGSWVVDGDCCKWAEVVCSNLTGHVLQLSLRNPFRNDLRYATTEYEDYMRSMLSGNVNPSLVDLKHLTHLDLSGNDFQGIRIPKYLGSLKNLRYLNLSGAEFAGIIPHQLGNLSNLRCLDLSWSEYALQVHSFSWLSGLSLLEHLDLSQMNLNKASDWLLGTISSIGLENLTSIKTIDLSLNFELGGPIPTSFVRLCELTSIDVSDVKLSQDLSQVLDILSACGASALESLVLSSSQISGHLTSQLGQFKSLRTLSLDDNCISGPLPPALGDLSSLTRLDLSRNMLNGSIPLSLGKISHLEYLDLSNNKMNGTLSEIHFVNLTKLTWFSASGNSLILQVNPYWVPPFQLKTLLLMSCHLGPQFPSWLHSQKNLSVLDISNARISDTIPRWFWNSIFQYEYLNISSNQIYGEIPDFDPLPPHTPALRPILDLSNNSLSGSMIHFICNGENKSHSIYFQKVSKNNFSGDIPDCWMNWPNLHVLNLGNNNFSGSLPISMGTLSSLLSLNLRNNRLSGLIPESFKNFSNLEVLNLGDNEFVGKIPTWMGEGFTSLLILILRSNKFDGFLPIQLCRLTSLQILDVANNSLSGTMPGCVNNFSAMATIDSSHQSNAMSYFEVTAYDCEVLEDASIVMKGSMVEYNSILNLVRIIDVSKNNFSGEIPMELTYLRGLQSLNFLSFLNHLNVSNNLLTGKIPSSTQLQSFDASCFVGNNLCGPPLPNCTENNARAPEDPNGNAEQDEDEVDWLLYVSIAVGFVVGFWCFIGPLLLNRGWRYKYCRFLDGCMDRFGCFVSKF
ncbi:hypothetical protein CICLE_v10027808mg [Citrus x clementina]|uniref:Leucine-rich repeat-containing N-terminal plant-type domain-containing protein n=1 Tax=Citrus clementina TaxID=85681 RepID=V4UDM2_CITCL|nr:hypothetical protein CICLE_v10027808mg [Citrus x clementina]